MINLSTEELLAFINSNHSNWRGTDHGDTVQAYQGRKAQQAAAALFLIGREMETDTPTLTENQAKKLFFEHLRDLLSPEMIDSGDVAESGTSRFCIEICLNQWKTATSLIYFRPSE